MSDGGDEFDALYGDSYDDEGLAQAEFAASQAVPGPSRPPALTANKESNHGSHNSRVKTSADQRGPLYHPPPQAQAAAAAPPPPPPFKKPRLRSPDHRIERDRVRLTIPEDEEDSLEVIWTENGYITRASSQRTKRKGPGPDDFEIRHTGPGRPPAMGAGHGQSLHEEAWERDEWPGATGNIEEWDKAEEEAVRSSQQQAGPSKQTQHREPPRRLGVGVPRPDKLVYPQATNEWYLNSEGKKTAGKSNAETPQSLWNGHNNLGSRQSIPPKQPASAPDDPDAAKDGSSGAWREELESMRAQLRAAVEDARTYKNKMYARDGEVKMVRDRNEKAERELAELRLKAQKQQEEFQKQLEEREKAFTAEKERIDTSAAFYRLEHETSAKRLAWPSSVRRRTAGAGTGRALGQAGSQTIGFSQSQYAVPPVMPTTPTRKGQGRGPSSPASQHRSGTQAHSSLSRREAMEDSPSKMRDQRRREEFIPPSTSSRLRGSAQRKANAFPGFDNSFAAERPRKQSPNRNSSSRPDRPLNEDRNDDVDMAIMEEVVTAANERVNESTPLIAFDGKASVIASRQRRYRWAVSAFFRRRTAIVTLLLAHYSPQPEPPLSLPRSRYLSTSILSPKPLPDHSATIHRVLDVGLPSESRTELQKRQHLAIELLLATMTDGTSTNDAEHRFSFLDCLPDDIPTTQEAVDDLDGHDYLDCQDAIEDGMQDLYDDLAVSLRTLLGIYLRLCMIDALQDVMALMTALSISEPSLINAFIAETLPYELEIDPLSFGIDGHEEQGVNDPSITQQDPSIANVTENLPTPVQLPICLVECLRKAGGVLPLSLSSPDSIALVESNDLPAASQHPGTTQSRKAREKAKRDSEVSLSVPWDMGVEQSEAVLEGMLSLLEVFVWHIGDQSGFYLRNVFDAPGFIATFLDVKRPAERMRRFIRLLTQLAQYPDMWKCLVACRFDSNLQRGLPALISQSRTPLLDLLAKHLVDLRHSQSPSDAHRLHCATNVLISQLVMNHDDALLLARQSQSLFAALIQAIYTDTALIWNEDGLCRNGQQRDAEDIVARLLLDVTLLSQIFYVESHPQELVDRLNSHDSHLLLNGIRHHFILALSRLAFSDEPSWVSEACVKDLQNVADKCSDLVETVLSPDEVEAVWEICAEEQMEDGSGEEEEEEDDDDGDRMMLDGDVATNGEAREGVAKIGMQGEGEDSQTQSEASIPLPLPLGDSSRR